ncbi:hypothetical protein AA977_06020 [Helicobacter pylori]|uniref:Uncharacterized protein n=1 Tax=Helicobacter pylori TaxID=210 RepID=A0A1A9HG12_HELPX|nr:hypothetical protein [Helicobacter pylori]ANH48683.1 hypothetical protein AA977_06020 [Helicobacter pylori]
MKIKAVMLALAVSGLLGFAKADYISDTESKIDNMVVNTDDPKNLKEILKAMVRFDYHQKEITALLNTHDDIIKKLAKMLMEQKETIEKLKKEVATVKAKIKTK